MRFFVSDGDVLEENRVILTGDNYHHLTKALRTKVGEEVEVCDGKGTDYFCKVVRIDSERTELAVDKVLPSAGESDLDITLFQCIPKGDKMEQIITHSIEMGVSRIVPVLSDFCVSRPAKNDRKKLERWQKIALSAAKQCGRGILPEILPITDIKRSVEMLSKLENAFVCFEKEKERSLYDIEIHGRQIGFLVGSEGGLSPAEQALWESTGIPAVTLGSRILRTETAASFVLPILLYKSNNL